MQVLALKWRPLSFWTFAKFMASLGSWVSSHIWTLLRTIRHSEKQRNASKTVSGLKSSRYVSNLLFDRHIIKKNCIVSKQRSLAGRQTLLPVWNGVRRVPDTGSKESWPVHLSHEVQASCLADISPLCSGWPVSELKNKCLHWSFCHRGTFKLCLFNYWIKYQFMLCLHHSNWE